MKQVFFFGYYGFQNTGDDAVLYSLLSDLTRGPESYRILVASENIEQTEKLYSRFSVEAIPWDNYVLVNLAIKQSDLLVIGGGGLYNCFLDYRGELFLRGGHREFGVVTFGLPYLAELWNTPCMVCGVGASEIRSNVAKEHIGSSLNKLAAITVRDRASQRLLAALPNGRGVHIEVGADPVFRLFAHSEEYSFNEKEKPLTDEINRLKKPILGVSLRNWSFSGDRDNLINSVAYAINSFSERTGGSVVFMPFDNGGTLESLSEDEVIFDDVIKNLDSKIEILKISEYLSPMVALRLVKECDYMICMRFHAVVMALSCGIPCVALAYDRKVRSAMELFNMEFACIDIEAVTHEAIDQRLVGIEGEKVKLKDIYEKRAKECSKSANVHAERIKQLLNNLLSAKKQVDPIYTMLRAQFSESLICQWVEEYENAFNAGDYITALFYLNVNPKEEVKYTYQKAFCLHQVRNHIDAIKNYNEALKNGFEPFWVYYNRGQCYKDMGNVISAKKDLSKAFDLDQTGEHKESISDILKNLESQL